MCNKFRILTIKEAQQDAENNPDPITSHIDYWRTTYGKVRKTGYVAQCKCRNRQYWGETKRSVIEKTR